MTYYFEHWNGRTVKIHVCNSPEEAKLHFQWSYGYWPDDPIRVEGDDA